MGKIFVKILFLLEILGMLLGYPAYFYLLFEFKTRMMRDHPDLWKRRESGALSYSGQSAYGALRSVRDGSLDGVSLSDAVVDSHRLATILLYVSMTCFMVVLFTFLYESLWGAGQQ